MRHASLGPHPLHARLAFALALLLVVAGAPAMAQYKWKDSRGQVHVSDLPPPRDIPDKDVLQRPAAPPARPAPVPAPAVMATGAAAASTASAAQPAKAPVDPELEARRKQAELDAQAKSKAEANKVAVQRGENCKRAREQMAALDSGQRMVRFNAQGEREVMDDAARANAVEQTRQVIASECR